LIRNKDPGIPEALVTGAVEAGGCYNFNLSTMFPEWNPIEQPGVIQTTAQLIAIEALWRS